jgi:hypothetical protein
MRQGNATCLIGHDKLIVIDHVPDRKMDKARQFVNDCLTAERGFCFRNVYHYPLAEGNWVRREIRLLKAERMALNFPIREEPLSGLTSLLDTQEDRDNRLRSHRITTTLAKYRKLEREHYSFDERAYRTLRGNYDKLNRALALLTQEGEVKSYTLRGTGELRINWFTEHEELKLDVIYQGWTWGIKHSEYTGNYHSHEDNMMRRMWTVFNRSIPLGCEGIPTVVRDEIVEQGMIDKGNVAQRITRGSGEYDVYATTYKQRVVTEPALIKPNEED